MVNKAKKPLNNAKKSSADVLKTFSKRAIQKTAEVIKLLTELQNWIKTSSEFHQRIIQKQLSMKIKYLN